MRSEEIFQKTHDCNPWDDALLLLAGIIAEKHLAAMKERVPPLITKPTTPIIKGTKIEGIPNDC